MFTARMNTFIHAPIERVWAFVTDYEGYARVPGVRHASLVKAGHPERSGVGAVRKIVVSGASFEEEITRFEAPHRLCYRITKSRPLHIEHEGGDMQLTARDGGTEVVWTTTMGLKMPLVGWLVTKLLGFVVQRQFTQFLLWVKRDLER